jgi:hypothetical protein
MFLSQQVGHPLQLLQLVLVHLLLHEGSLGLDVGVRGGNHRLEVGLVLLQLHQLPCLDPPLLVQPLKHPFQAPLGHHEQRVRHFGVPQVGRQLGHHPLQQLPYWPLLN